MGLEIVADTRGKSASWLCGDGRTAITYLGASLPGAGLVNALPFMTGALIDRHGYRPTMAGGLVTAELVTAAAVALVTSGRRFPLNPRSMGFLGCALFALGSLVAVDGRLGALLIGRGLAGLGGGLAISAAGQFVACAARPARVGALASVALAGAAAAVALVSGWLATHAGYPALTALLAGVGAVGAPLCLTGPATVVSPSGPVRAHAGPRETARCMALLACPFLLFLASGSLWSFVDRLGRHLGLDAMAIAQITALTAFAGIAGALSALAAARWLGEATSAAIGVLSCAVSIPLLAAAETPAVYALAMAVLSFAVIYVVPFLTALAARLDPTGWASGATLASIPLAGSLGPLLGGLIIERHGLAPLPAVTLGLCAAAILALAFAIWPKPQVSPSRSTA